MGIFFIICRWNMLDINKKKYIFTLTVARYKKSCKQMFSVKLKGKSQLIIAHYASASLSIDTDRCMPHFGASKQEFISNNPNQQLSFQSFTKEKRNETNPYPTPRQQRNNVELFIYSHLQDKHKSIIYRCQINIKVKSKMKKI